MTNPNRDANPKPPTPNPLLANLGIQGQRLQPLNERTAAGRAR
jgi:hypothetical protein